MGTANPTDEPATGDGGSVLQGVLVQNCHRKSPDDQRLVVVLLLVGPGESRGDELSHPGQEEQAAQGDAQAVIPPYLLHPQLLPFPGAGKASTGYHGSGQETGSLVTGPPGVLGLVRAVP